MEACAKITIPQGKKDLPADCDRMQAPVISTGPTKFWGGGDQVHKHLRKNSEGSTTTTVAAENISTLDSEEEAYFQNLVRQVKEVHSQTEKATNTQKSIKDVLKAAVAIIRCMTTTRDDIKGRAHTEAARIEIVMEPGHRKHRKHRGFCFDVDV